MLDEPQILRTTAQPIAVIHLAVPRAEIQRIMGPAHRELAPDIRSAMEGPTFPG